MTDFKKLCLELEEQIKQSYELGVTLPEAEKLAGKFLYAQMQVSAELKAIDLESRMRKAGVKAVRAAIYLEAATKDPKKPSDVLLAALVDSNEIVAGEQKRLDESEVNRDELERYNNIFLNAHIYFRGLAKQGSYNG